MKYDLLVTDGEVLDPAAGLKGQLDVAISGGKIVEVAASLPKNEARRTISARGLLVTPGLVDIHANIFVYDHDMGGHPDRFCSASGVTTLCDAGSTGSATFAGLRQIIDHQVRTRTRAFVNLSAIGIVGTSRGGELSHFPYADPEGCARTIAENPDLAIGVKLRYGPGIVWEYTTEPVKLARKTAAMAGVPLMIHVTDSPIPLPDIVERATAAPARILGYDGTVGTLKPGANADIALIERRNGNVDLTDSDGNTVTAKERLVTRMTIKDGRVWYERPGD